MDRKRLRFGPGETAAILMLVWGLYLFGVWEITGLFRWIGIDYALLSASAKLIESKTPEACYDVDAVARQIEPLRAYYHGPENSPLRVGPVPHLPLTLLLYVPFAQLAPPWGYLLWLVVNLVLAVVVVRGLAARFPDARSWSVTALALCYFPLFYTLFMGQPIILMLFAFDRAYRAWERDRDFAAGLWCGVLFLKFQYLPILVLVLACKQRWRSLAGIAVTCLVIALGSFAVAGESVTAAYMESLKSVSGFRHVHPLIMPQHMINWRGLLVQVLPAWVSEAQGKALTLLLSALTASSLAVVWQGPWDPAGPRFPMQMLATLLITMVVSFHNHIHGAALLVVPAMVLWARGGGPSPLPMLLKLGLVTPAVLCTFLFSLDQVVFLFFGLMLTTLGAILWIIWAERAGARDPAASSSRRRELIPATHLDGMTADG